MRNSNPYFLLDNAVVNVTLCTRITACPVKGCKICKICKSLHSLLNSFDQFNSATAEFKYEIGYL